MVAQLDWRSRIAADPRVHHGEPCVKGTRVPVAVVVASLADLPREALLEQFPQLTIDDVRACLLFAAEASHRTVVA
jgi:uncharacterized protein (DUF433 family)